MRRETGFCFLQRRITSERRSLLPYRFLFGGFPATALTKRTRLPSPEFGDGRRVKDAFRGTTHNWPNFGPLKRPVTGASVPFREALRGEFAAAAHSLAPNRLLSLARLRVYCSPSMRKSVCDIWSAGNLRLIIPQQRGYRRWRTHRRIPERLPELRLPALRERSG